MAEIILDKVSAYKLEIIKLLRHYTHLGLADAKNAFELIESGSPVFITQIPKERVREVLWNIAALDGHAVISKSGDAYSSSVHFAFIPECESIRLKPKPDSALAKKRAVEAQEQKLPQEDLPQPNIQQHTLPLRANGQIAPTRCADCAYIQKDGNFHWCPFHDVAISPNQICEDFLHLQDSPMWKVRHSKQLIREVPQHTQKDKLAYCLTGLIFALALLIFIALYNI